MVHELIGLNNNLVNMSKVNSKEVSVRNSLSFARSLCSQQQIVLSPEHDVFYRENMYKVQEIKDVEFFILFNLLLFLFLFKHFFVFI